jgi:hypothetical protein
LCFFLQYLTTVDLNEVIIMNFDLRKMLDTVCGLFKGTLPAFAWKITTLSVSLAGLWAKDQFLKFQI